MAKKIKSKKEKTKKKHHRRSYKKQPLQKQSQSIRIVTGSSGVPQTVTVPVSVPYPVPQPVPQQQVYPQNKPLYEYMSKPIASSGGPFIEQLPTPQPALTKIDLSAISSRAPTKRRQRSSDSNAYKAHPVMSKAAIEEQSSAFFGAPITDYSNISSALNAQEPNRSFAELRPDNTFMAPPPSEDPPPETSAFPAETEVAETPVPVAPAALSKKAARLQAAKVARAMRTQKRLADAYAKLPPFT